MRVYIPATLSMLERLVDNGFIQPFSGTAFAVTPGLRESYAQGDDEELGEVAIGQAALASLRLLAAEPDPRPRRTVLIADADATPRPDLDDAVVRIEGRVALDQVTAAYVDNAAAEPAVQAAIAVIDEADLGDEDAELTVGDAQDHDLAWYDRSELPFLIELL
ncbi:MAG TPA: hypothetical protein PLK19_05320 [Mycobacterium sp.]|jgi:hypothetical protein|nr:hypothetical protein [Mycobacterium sp.]